MISICAEGWNVLESLIQPIGYILMSNFSYLDLEIDELIPLWICIFLNDFGAQL